MTITVEKALLNNQSTLENFGLVEELDAQSAEIISGGWGCGYHRPMCWPGYLAHYPWFGYNQAHQDIHDHDDVHTC